MNNKEIIALNPKENTKQNFKKKKSMRQTEIVKGEMKRDIKTVEVTL